MEKGPIKLNGTKLLLSKRTIRKFPICFVIGNNVKIFLKVLTTANYQLQSQDELFKECLDNLNNAFAIYEALFNKNGEITDFQIKYVNKAACQFFNTTYEEIVGKRLIKGCPKIATCFLEKLCHIVKTGNPYQGICENYQIELYNVRDNSIAFSWRNITENSRLEQELKCRMKKIG